MSLVLHYILIPYLVAVIMPNWRWLLGCTLIVGSVIAYLWIDHWIAIGSPNYSDGPGGALGVAIFFCVTVGFASGIVVRLLSLLAGIYDRRKTALAICVLGLALPMAVLSGPGYLDQWRRRPAPESCTESGFRVEIARAKLAIPAANLFTVYRGRASGDETYYLRNVGHLRTLCGMTSDGAQPIKATNLAIRFDDLWRGQPPCRPDAPGWAADLCADAEPIRNGRIDDTDFPITAYVFSLNEVRLGDFLGAASTFRDSEAGLGRADEYYAPTDLRTPDGNPLTFRCHPQGDGSHWCSTSYPWTDGAYVNYVFRAQPGHVAARGKRVDAALRDFLAGLRVGAPS